MLEFLWQHWIDILSLLAAIGAVVAAMYANHRVNVIHRQDMQEPLYADMRRLLNYKCDYHSAEQRAIDCYNAVPSVSADEEEAIKRKVYRFFGEIEYKQLCRILALSSQARDIDFDIGILFDLIKAKTSEIREHYIRDFGAIPFSRLDPYLLLIDGKAARELFSQYLKEE